MANTMPALSRAMKMMDSQGVSTLKFDLHSEAILLVDLRQA